MWLDIIDASEELTRTFWRYTTMVLAKSRYYIIIYDIWLIRKWAEGTWADRVGSIPVTVGVDSAAQGLDMA